MALLWRHLPAESRTARMQEASLRWDAGEYLLWQIEYELRLLLWSLTNTKENPQPKPKPIENPARAAELEKKAEAAMGRKDEIARRLGLEGRV